MRYFFVSILLAVTLTGMAAAQAPAPAAPPAPPAPAGVEAAPAPPVPVAEEGVQPAAPPGGQPGMMAPPARPAPPAMYAQAAPPPPAAPPAMAPPPPPPVHWYAAGKGSYLGIGVQEIGAERAKQLKLSEPHGVEVTTVTKESPAAKAGIKEGDVVLEFNGQRVEGSEQFVRLVRETPPGREVKLGISRDGASQTVTATVGDRKEYGPYMDPKYVQKLQKMGEDMQHQFGPGSPFQQDMQHQFGPDSTFQQDMRHQFGPDSDFQRDMQKLRDDMEKMHWEMHMPDLPEGPGRGARLGVEAEPVGPQLAEFFGVKQGVLVRSVAEGSAAEKAGIKAGDVIVKIGNGDVDRVGTISKLMREAEAGKPVPVTVVRNKKWITLSVTPGAKAGAGQ